MKTADITPRTVLYALQERSYRDPQRVVVLSTTVHRMGAEQVGPDERAVTLRPRPGEHFRKPDYRGVGVGLPVIKAAHGAHESEITDAELLAAAAALPEQLDGPLPKVVGPGIHFTVVRSASLKMTWAEHLAADQRGKEARQAYLAREAAYADDEIRFRNAVTNLLRSYGVTTVWPATYGPHGDNSTRVAEMDWSELLKILEDLRDGVLDQTGL